MAAQAPRDAVGRGAPSAHGRPGLHVVGAAPILLLARTDPARVHQFQPVRDTCPAEASSSLLLSSVVCRPFMTFSESCRDVFEGAPPTAGVDRNVQYVPSMLVDHFGNQPSEESAESLRRRPSGGARKDFWMPSGPIPLTGVRFPPPYALGDRRWLHVTRVGV